MLLWGAVAAFGTYRLATWSCGRTVAAVVDGRTFRTDVWRMDASGHPCQRLTSDGGSWSPLRSPDGKWVAYASHAGFGGRSVDTDDGIYSAFTAVHVIRSDGSRDIRLTAGISSPVRWSVDGRRLTYCEAKTVATSPGGQRTTARGSLVTVTFPSLRPVSRVPVARCIESPGRILLWQNVRAPRLYWPFD
jgi:hypothetical protein